MSGITNQDVLEDSSTPVREDVKPQESKAKEQEAPKPEASAPGTKTPESNLLAALHEERMEKKALAERIKQLEASNVSASVADEVFSDEGKLLHQSISTLENRVKELTEEREMEQLYRKHPELADVAEDFKSFRLSYPGVSLDKVANLFLVEKGLKNVERKGLESSSGGAKLPPPTAMSEDDMKRLREDNPRKWQQLVMDGKI